MAQTYNINKCFVFVCLLISGICNAADSFQERFLEAARKGDLEEVKALRAIDAQHTYVNDKGRNALLEAAKYGHEDIIKFLVEEGADINAQDKDGHSAFFHAIGNKNSIEIIKFLHAKGASHDVIMLHHAAATGDLDVITFLLSIGYNIDDQSDFYYNETSLMEALANKHEDAANLLIEKGANVDLKNKYGMTALHIASMRGATEAVKLILNKGTDIDAKNSRGRTALLEAAKKGHLNVVAQLLDAKADKTVKDANGNTALHFLAKKKGNEIAELLMQYPNDNAQEN